MTLGVAALVFGAIPFTQNKASAQDLAAVRTAQGVAKVQSGRYLSLGSLRNAGYISPSDTLAVATDPSGSCFVSVSRSGSGRLLISTDQSPTPVELVGAPETGCVSPAKVAELAGKAGGVGPAPVMTTVWDTGLATERTWDPPCTTITLPLTGTINATIDWGDGSPPQTVTSELPAHTYTGATGIKTVRIEGTFTGWVGYYWPDWSADCLTAVTEWGETGTTDVEAGFYDALNLVHVPRIPLTTTNWAYLFTYTKFNSDVSWWDTSGVTDMTGMFNWAEDFNQPLDNWDTSNVTHFGAMFAGATSFNQPVNSWDTSRATDMNSMFNSAYSFNQPLDKWDTSSVTEMGWMFSVASVFNQPLDRWDTSNVTSMNRMFHEASAFNQDLSGWNTGRVTSADGFSFDSPLTPGHLPPGALFR